MVIDSSALVAIIAGEPERRVFVELINLAGVRLVAAPTLLETSMVLLGREGEMAVRAVRDFCTEARVEVVPFDQAQLELAIDAFRRFGKGRHPAGLNFGDSFAYALAQATGEPLLFKGDDFAQTDVKRAL